MGYEITVRTRLKGRRRIKFEQIKAEKEKSIADILRDAIDLMIEREDIKRN